jgi:hypothetical protein
MHKENSANNFSVTTAWIDSIVMGAEINEIKKWNA